MEKISVQATFTQVSLYARYAATNTAKKSGAAGVSDAAKTAADQTAFGNGGNAAKGIACGQSKDGDTFSLSIEASLLQISETVTVTGDGSGTDAPAALGTDGNGTAATANASGNSANPEALTGSGLVHALMDALKSIGDKNGATGSPGAHGRHRHHFPKLGDAQDVADNLMQQIDGRQAAQGGSKADFAADIKKRLADWKPGSKVTVAYQEFRSEVHMKLTQGLDAWAGAGAITDPAPVSGSDAA